MINRIKISDNFVLNEFQCRHCQQVKLDSDLLEKLQEIRDIINQPLYVTSGYRCKEHNTAVGGATNSQHLKGKAADIRAHGIAPINIADIATVVGLKGIGVYDTFAHVDTRKRGTFWRG